MLNQAAFVNGKEPPMAGIVGKIINTLRTPSNDLIVNVEIEWDGETNKGLAMSLLSQFWLPLLPEQAEQYEAAPLKRGYRLTDAGCVTAKQDGLPVTDYSLGLKRVIFPN